MAYATETEKYAQEAQDYLDRTHDYLNNKLPGRTIRLVDPRADQFSQAADDKRQLSAIQKANGQPNAQDSPEIIDLGEGDTNSQPEVIDLSESQPERSRGLAETYQSHRPDWNAPPKTAEHPVAKDAARVLNALSPITNVLQEIAAPFETAGDYYRGLISPKTVLPGINREGSFAGPQTTRELNPSIDQALQAGDPATALVREFATGIMTNPAYIGMSPLLRRPAVPMPQPISQTDLKVLSAEEMLGGRPAEMAREATTVAAPQAIPFEAPNMHGYTSQPTGRFVLPTGAEPGITDLARAHQARMLEDTKTGAFYGQEEALPLQRTESHEARPAPTPTAVDLVSGKAELDRGKEQFTSVFEKPHALRTAEEILQERQQLQSKPLHGREDVQIREANAFIPRGSSESATEGAITGARQASAKVSAKEMKLQETREEINQEFAIEYVNEQVAKQKAPAKEPVRVAGVELPKTFDHLNTEGLFPSTKQRITEDVLSVIGKFSPAWKGASESILKAYEIAGREASQSLDKFTNDVSGLFGERPWFTRKGMAFKDLTRGENVAIAKAQRAFNLDADVEEAAFNYLYTAGKMEPPMSMPAAKREQAIKYATMVYEDMLKPTSEHPGVRQIQIKDPFTGKTFAPGEPSMFVPHQPIKEITKDALNQNQWKLLYERMGGEAGTSGDLQAFINRVVSFSRRDPEVGISLFEMPNLQQKRLLDLTALGGSPYQQAKRLGYETDLFSAAVRHRTNGTLRGELQLLKPGIDSLRAASNFDKDAAIWLDKALNYAMKVPHGVGEVQPLSTNAILGVRRWVDTVLLGMASLSNLTQFAYPVARAMGTPVLGAKANLRGVMDYVFGNNQELIKQSGALLPYYLNQYSHPTGPLAVFHSNVMNMYGMPHVDRQTRLFAGHIGNRYVSALADQLLANPTSKTHAKILDEMGGPGAAKAILTEGKVNDNLRLEMIQRFANQTAATLDARGLPWYATSENPFAKMVLQYKPFLIANSAELQRSIANAPTKLVAMNRFAALMTVGGATATGVYEAKQMFQHFVQGDNYEPPNRDGVYALERALAGLSGAYAMVLLDLAENPERTLANMAGGPTLGYATGFAKDLKASLKHGPGWRSLRTLSELPVVGPLTHSYVKGRATEESQQLRESGE